MTTDPYAITYQDVLDSAERIKGHAEQTPLVRLDILDGVTIWVKCENEQVTGSYKYRGAFNVLTRMSYKDKARGVVTRSSGNFSQALAAAAEALGIKATIIIPKNAPSIKIAGSQKFGAEIIMHKGTIPEQHALAAQLSEEHGMTLLSPYNHPGVVMGQGTLALEAFAQAAEQGQSSDGPVTHFIGPVGGGGLMGGCATYIHHAYPECQILSAEPEGSNAFFQSFEAKRQIEVPSSNIDTIADGVRTPMVGDIPWPILRDKVHAAHQVSEQDIKNAMAILAEFNIRAEPSGAVPLAALLYSVKPAQGNYICVISGGNVDEPDYQRWVSKSK